MKVGPCVPILVIVTSMASCNFGPRLYEVTGSVNLNGQPLSEGKIVLEDFAGVLVSDVGVIVDGQFRFQASEGKKKVIIKSIRWYPFPKGQHGPMGEIKYPKQILPKRYNTATELLTEVSARGIEPNVFELTSSK